MLKNHSLKKNIPCMTVMYGKKRRIISSKSPLSAVNKLSRKLLIKVALRAKDRP